MMVRLISAPSEPSVDLGIEAQAIDESSDGVSCREHVDSKKKWN